MGNYRSTPAVEIEREEGSGPFYEFASASMQGWRIQQEDAHACLPKFDEDKEISMFAVFDGHGGFEVSKYCALRLPDHIKNDLGFKQDDYKEALEEAFMSFDKSLRTPEVIKELNNILDNKPMDGAHDSEPEDVNGLLEEACTPLEKVLQKYVKEKLGVNPDGTTNGNKLVASGDKSEEAGSASAGGSSSSAGGSGNTPSRPARGERKKETPTKAGAPDDKDSSEDDSEEDETFDSEDADSSGSGDSDAVVDDSGGDGDSGDDEEDEDEENEGGKVVAGSNWLMKYLKRKRAEEASSEEEEGEGPPKRKRPILTGLSSTPAIESGTTAVVALLGKDKVTVANIGDSRAILGRLTKSKDGATPKMSAVELSKDHKPELPEEKERIENAGGEVDEDGRVDGGLNLSRAFGDFVFKANKDLPAEKQEVIAFPDIVTEKLHFGDDEDDKFLFVACDGIWNDMTSEEVANFIWDRLNCNVPLNSILEQMFNEILAPNLSGDGTGCDNMTAILVNFNKNSSNATASVVDEVAK